LFFSGPVLDTHRQLRHDPQIAHAVQIPLGHNHIRAHRPLRPQLPPGALHDLLLLQHGANPLAPLQPHRHLLRPVHHTRNHSASRHRPDKPDPSTALASSPFLGLFPLGRSIANLLAQAHIRRQKEPPEQPRGSQGAHQLQEARAPNHQRWVIEQLAIEN